MSMQHEKRPSFSMGRRWSISLNVVLSIIAVLAMVGMINYLAARHFRRIPVSALAQSELSPQTHRILQSVTNNVHVIIYYDREDDLYELIHGLLKEYKFANGRIGVETVDYQRDPAAAQSVKAKYQLPVEQKNLVIFSCNGNKKIVYEKELSDLDLEPLISGRSKEVRRSAFKGELLFTSAIYSVTSPRTLKAYFLKGHGEHEPDSADKDYGFSKFAGLLKDNNIDWGAVSLAGTNDIPGDCSLLIVAGARVALPPTEVEKIDAYLNNGGRALFMFNIFGIDRNTGIEDLLGNWGVEVGRAVAWDRANSTMGQDLLVSHFSTHPIAAPLINSGVHMVFPRAMGKAQRSGRRADGVVELAFTSAKGMAVTDIRDGVPHPSPTGLQTNVPVAIAVEKGKLQGTDRGTTRMVVLGDSVGWANNMLDNLANRDFASLTINWLLDRSQLLGSLSPQPIARFRLVMSKAQVGAVRWIMLLGMPGSVLLLGTIVWVRRRS
jgi:ABC-2 type transport system permease protein